MVKYSIQPVSLWILIDTQGTLEPLDESGRFHHKQSEHYYAVLQLALMLNPAAPEEIPLNKPVDFYKQLKSFLSGDSALPNPAM